MVSVQVEILCHEHFTLLFIEIPSFTQEALAKLKEAEIAKHHLQTKMKEKEKEKRIGLARPIQPEARPLPTHRGLGAFPKTETLAIKSAAENYGMVVAYLSPLTGSKAKSYLPTPEYPATATILTSDDICSSESSPLRIQHTVS